MTDQPFSSLLSENERKKEVSMDELDLLNKQTPIAYRIAAGFLLFNVLISIISIFIGGGIQVVSIIIDLAIAIYLLKLDDSAKTIALIRAVLGGIIWPIYKVVTLGFNLESISFAVVQLAFCGALIIILTGKTKEWRIVTSITIFSIFFVLPVLLGLFGLISG